MGLEVLGYLRQAFSLAKITIFADFKPLNQIIAN